VKIVISSAARTPIGSLQGALGSVTAGKLGAAAIKGAMDRAGVEPAAIDALFMGNVLQAGQGQAPARQAAIYAGLDPRTPAVTLNKMCGSGLESIIQASRAVALGDATVAVAGGMESMTNAPYLVPGARGGLRLGNATLVDSLVHDGLWDVYNDKHMGSCAELCATKYGFSRGEQDDFAEASYRRAQRAQADGTFAAEIVPVEVVGRKGDVTHVDTDEGPKQVDFEKLRKLRPVFEKDGTVTAANASTINDGAAALVVMSADKAKELGLKPIAKVLSYAEAEQAPEWFTTSPAKAAPLAVKKAGLEMKDIEYFEFNEAFSVVGIANTKILGLDPARVNVNGGAVSLGHPLGCSGARIIVTLINVLKQNNARYGLAGICNGGGGASAIVIEAL